MDKLTALHVLDLRANATRDEINRVTLKKAIYHKIISYSNLKNADL